MIKIQNKFIVTDENRVPLVSTILLSENMDLMHDSILTTIEKNKILFLDLGNGNIIKQDFKEALNISNNKSLLKKRKAFYLNEPQVNFLFSLSRNTDEIIKFKFAITKAFNEMKNQLQAKTVINTQSMQIQVLQETLNQLSIMDNRVSTLEDSKVINSRQRHALKLSVSKKVFEIKEKHNFSDDFIRKGYQRIWKKLKDKYLVSSYMDIPCISFDECLFIISNVTVDDLI